VWQEDIIRIATLIQPPKDAPRGTADIMRTLRDTLQYVSDCDGRIPTTHLDHVYEQVLEYIHTNSKGKRAQEGPRNRPQKNKEPKRSYKRYIYSRTQDLFKNNPGELARYVRSNRSWYEKSTLQLAETVIREQYGQLWGTTPHVQQPYTGNVD